MPANVTQWAIKRTKRRLSPHLISSLAPLGRLELLLTSSTDSKNKFGLVHIFYELISSFWMGSLADGYVKWSAVNLGNIPSGVSGQVGVWHRHEWEWHKSSGGNQTTWRQTQAWCFIELHAPLTCARVIWAAEWVYKGHSHNQKSLYYSCVVRGGGGEKKNVWRC